MWSVVTITATRAGSAALGWGQRRCCQLLTRVLERRRDLQVSPVGIAPKHFGRRQRDNSTHARVDVLGGLRPASTRQLVAVSFFLNLALSTESRGLAQHSARSIDLSSHRDERHGGEGRSCVDRKVVIDAHQPHRRRISFLTLPGIDARTSILTF
jgi:hypothetical protein